MAMEWLDTGLVVFTVPGSTTEQDTIAEPAADDAAAPGVLSLPIYPTEFNRSYVSDHHEITIPSYDGQPGHQRIIYVLSHTIDGKSRHMAIYEIVPGTGALLTYGPPELLGDNRIEGNAVQPHFLPIEVQRPPQPPNYYPQPPEYQLRLYAVIERADKTAWTLRMVYPDLPIYWHRHLPGQ